MAELGVLKRVELRDVWQHEGYHFTPWLAEAGNLTALSEVLGIDLELVGQEVCGALCGGHPVQGCDEQHQRSYRKPA